MTQQTKTSNVGYVYIIFCLLWGIAYIGESRRQLIQRLKEHFDLLRRNHHENEGLQEDWNNLDPDCFVAFPVEEVKDLSLLAARERAWTRKCLIEGKVYNQRNAITERHKQAFLKHKPKWPTETVNKSAKEYTFISPTGIKMKVKGLRGICEAYDLNPSHMSKVARGIYVQHRGFTAKLNEDI
jgi:hypothetical protein